MSEVRCNQILV